MASPKELNTVVLWFSHILIRYDGVLDPRTSFCLLDWWSAYPPSQRSRGEALQWAQSIANDAASGTVPFADLVAAYSEDITTADRGGSLGGMTASQLAAWRPILDALAVLEPGQTSEVVETPYGFHILQKRAPPPEETVSGAHIVIGNDDALWLRHGLLRGKVSHRSRAVAESLAWQVFQRARSHPDEFSELVERYSEHRDAEVHGDIGQWSTREPLAPSREIETLAHLRIGEVSPPIETFLGFQILMRTANRDRLEFAHEALEVMFDPTAAEESPNSEAKARERALEIGARLKREPQAFDALRAERCCEQVHVWREGRAEKSIQVALSELRIGEIGTTPVRTAASYAFLRRLDPKLVPPPLMASYELPSHSLANLDGFLGSVLEGKKAEGVVRALGARAADELVLDEERREQLLELHRLPTGIGTGNARVRDIAAIAKETQALLTPAEYRAYRDVATGLVEQAILDRH